MKKEVRVFTLPGEERLLSELVNQDLLTVTNKIITPCPKEGIILYLVEYEDYREE